MATNEVICFYHANCLDGIGSAAIVKKAYSQAQCFPVMYDKALPIDPEHLRGATVFIVDFSFSFSFSADFLCEIAEYADRIVLIDHHKTADKLRDAQLPHNVTLHLDTSNEHFSGVGRVSGTDVLWDTKRHEFLDGLDANDNAAAPVPAQPAAAKGSTHCDECGCDWLDNGLNPVGCPYCKRNDDKFNPCLNSLVRQVTLMMDDCEAHADGSITIDCDISQGFLRRIYDLLSALEDGGYDAIEPQPAAPDIGPMDILRALRDVQPAAVPEAVAKPSARAVAVSWCSLKHSTKQDLLKSFGIVCPQGKSETDLSWSLRALEAMGNRPKCVAAILSAADSRSPDKCQCNAEGEVTDACKDCPR